MAKKKGTISELLKTGKTGSLSTEAIDRATRKIKATEKPEGQEKTKRLSVDTPLSLYIELKKKVAEDDISIRDFVLEQIRKGINE